VVENAAVTAFDKLSSRARDRRSTVGSS